jgi:hypothetical protein
VSDEYAYADRIFGAAARWLRSSPFVPALLALGFAAGFIHYLLDRAAFRFSSPDVRQAARGCFSVAAGTARKRRNRKLGAPLLTQRCRHRRARA